MKNLFITASLMISAFLIVSCGSSKEVVSSSPAQSENSTVTNLEGDRVQQEISKMTGIENGEALNEDGTEVITRPYKWYAGLAKADNKQVAIEMAQAEAYATISKNFNNIIDSKIEEGELVNNGKVQQAIRSYWEQISQTILKGCEPYGDVVTQFNKKDGMYSVNAKVAMRGDRYMEILSEATSYMPNNLSGDDLKQFVETNKAIVEGAKADM